MRVNVAELNDIQAAAIFFGMIGFAWLVSRVVPTFAAPVPPKQTRFSDAEITAHDPALPKYFLAAGIALAVGGIHAAIKSLPPLYHWLSEAGHGGHMVRDLANTHLVIVVGGTVAVTGLTWYVLPRVARRPLYSHSLAGWSFWCTVLGAGGFYLTQTVFGIILGRMAHEGIPYEQGKELLGAWRAAPIGLSATVMGIGYWTFVLNVLVTVWQAREVTEPRPHRHLLKFFAIGALGLFIGTVQGVIQVMPDNEAWLHATAPAGEYIDPIAHAHVNLVTGTLSLVAGVAFFWSAPSPRRKQVEEAVFWTMVPGSLLFYLTFMWLGFTEGGLMYDHHLTYEQAVARLGIWHTLPLAVAGTWMLAGIWSLLATLVWRFARGPERTQAGAPLLVGAAVALFVGTSHGLLQILPGVKAWLVSAGEPGDAIANAHAQLNMLGGVLLAQVGLALSHSRVLIGVTAPRWFVKRVLILIGSGVALYYLSATATAYVMGEVIRQAQPLHAATVGHSHGGTGAAAEAMHRALAQVDPFGPLGMALGAALYGAGFLLFARFAWAATPAYRREGWRRFRHGLATYDGATPAWQQQIPARYFLAAELVFGSMGFPGLGWLLSGRSLIGLPLALFSPAIAWGVIPVMMLPADGALSGRGVLPVLFYLAGSTALSLLFLGLRLARSRGRLPFTVRSQGVV